MDSTAKKQHFILNVYNEKCPKCKKGQVFIKNQNIFSLPVMLNHCSNCNYRFEREPGYFIGAMYLSYALSVFQGGVVFLLCYFLFPTLSITWVVSLILITLILFTKKNYKWSRILYLYIFPW